MPKCIRCSKEITFLGSIGYNKQTRRCWSCEKDTKRFLDEFRQAFRKYSSDGIISTDEWRKLKGGTAKRGIDMNEALAYVRMDALILLERTLTFAAADGIVTNEEEQTILQLREDLALPGMVARPVLDRLAYLTHLTSIRYGSLPTVQSSVQLESDELCHLETNATYHKVNTKSVSRRDGRLIATNKKLHFLSSSGGFEIGWKNIMRVERHSDSIYLELSRKSGNGKYDVADPILVEAIIETLVRIAKREILTPSAKRNSRHITQDVKKAVWQRDQGKCVQCGAAQYLEFDHIIPHSKGGANTQGNVQLLCRRCNAAKSDRI